MFFASPIVRFSRIFYPEVLEDIVVILVYMSRELVPPESDLCPLTSSVEFGLVPVNLLYFPKQIQFGVNPIPELSGPFQFFC